MNIIDLTNCPLNGRTYGGDAGQKYGITYNNESWLIKFPRNTQDLEKVNLSYTTTPASEYIGSQIYQALNIPVHDTFLGVRENKVVVACKDFLDRDKGEVLVEFKNFKNSFSGKSGQSYTSGASTEIDEVLDTIENSELVPDKSAVLLRFWQMFVVDALISNNDRHNMNWGFIEGKGGDKRLAPVYDNGGAFYSKKDNAKIIKSLRDDTLLAESFDFCSALAIDGHKIRPFIDDLSKYEATLRPVIFDLISKWQAVSQQIFHLISDIPATYKDMQILPESAAEYYTKVLEVHAQRFGEMVSGKSIPS